MCDYSLCGLPNRLAVEGEVLEVHKFSTGSMGLASPGELHKPIPEAVVKKGFWHSVKGVFDLCRAAVQSETAVCVPPGADLILKGIPPHLQQRLGVREQEGVKFAQTSAAANTYRDAVQFKNGRMIGLQDLPEGLQVEILSLARVYADEEQEYSTAQHTFARSGPR